jgi:Holliday junction resolvasome RuvABC endonuclease subunit
MRVIGIDPSLRHIGVALFDDDNLLCTEHFSPRKSIEYDDFKSYNITGQLCNFVKRNQPIDLIVYERATGKPRDFNAIRGIYQAVGWMEMLVVALRIFVAPNISYDTVTPLQVKEAATGRKRQVDKREMIAAALKLYPNALTRKKDGSVKVTVAEHEADAIFVYEAYKLLSRFSLKRKEVIT